MRTHAIRSARSMLVPAPDRRRCVRRIPLKETGRWFSMPRRLRAHANRYVRDTDLGDGIGYGRDRWSRCGRQRPEGSRASFAGLITSAVYAYNEAVRQQADRGVETSLLAAVRPVEPVSAGRRTRMSKAFGPKGVRARLIASFQLPAHGLAPPRIMGGGAAGWNGRTAPTRTRVRAWVHSREAVRLD